MTMKKVNLKEKFDLFEEFWTPKIVDELNGQYVKLAKAKGELVWHTHDNEDELFLVIKGRLTINLRDQVVHLGAGEFFVVPKGVEHKPEAERETHILLFEPKETAHTGNVQSHQTVATEKQSWI